MSNFVFRTLRLNFSTTEQQTLRLEGPLQWPLPATVIEMIKEEQSVAYQGMFVTMLIITMFAALPACIAVMTYTIPLV